MIETGVLIVSTVISIGALGLSIWHIWFTMFRLATVKMTRPTIVALTHDSEELVPKIFVRGLLYCTGHRGRVIESMFANLRHGSSTTTFAFWGYGDSQLQKGSGLFVDPEGIAVNHHFVLLARSDYYQYKPGEYTVEVFAELVGDSTPYKLVELNLSVTEEMAAALNDKQAGVMFNWNPNNRVYRAEVQPPRIDDRERFGVVRRA